MKATSRREQPGTNSEDGDAPTHLSPQTAIDFSALAGFNVSSVSTISLGVDGFVTGLQSQEPLQASLGECCRDPSCPYPTAGLTVFPSVLEVAHALIRLGQRSYPPIPATVILEGFAYDVFHVRAREPLVLADMRRHPILYRVPLSFRILRDSNKDSEAWELVRTIKDRRQVAGLLLPLAEGDSGYDLAVHRDHQNQLAFTRIGSLAEAIPLLDAPRTKTLQVLMGLLDRWGPR